MLWARSAETGMWSGLEIGRPLGQTGLVPERLFLGYGVRRS